MTDTEKAVVVAPVSKELVALGSRVEIRELTRRIQTMAPGGIKLTPEQALTLAQYSFSLGANPLVGEAWALVDKNGKMLGLMPGIRLYRRRADEKDERLGDVRWLESEVIADSERRASMGIPADVVLAVRVRLYRQSQTKAYADMATSLSQAGAPWDDIKQIAGMKPYIEGVGYLTQAEHTALERAGDSNKMPHLQRVLKRAEAHALKQAYSLPFGFMALTDDVGNVPSGALLEDYVYEGEWKEVETPPDTRSEEQRKQETVVGAQALYGDDAQIVGDGVRRAKHSWSAAHVDAALRVLPPDTKKPHVVSILQLTPCTPQDDPERVARWVAYYHTARADLPETLNIRDAQTWADEQFDKLPAA